MKQRITGALKYFLRVGLTAAAFSLVFAAAGAPARASETSGPLIDELTRSTGGEPDVSYQASSPLVRFLRLKQPERRAQVRGLSAGGGGEEPAARDFLSRYGGLFGLGDQAKELSVERTKTVEDGRSFVRFQQKIGGLPVFGGELIVQTDSSGDVVSVNGKTSSQSGVDTTPSIDGSVAVEKALGLVSGRYRSDRSLLSASAPELYIYNPSLLDSGPNVNRLVWRVEVTASDLRPIDEIVLIDAHGGGIALHFNQTGFAKSRVMYDNNEDWTKGLPGNGPVWIEGSVLPPSYNSDPVGLADIIDAYNYTGLTYDFFHDVLGRDSIDNAGMPLISTIRYCPSSAQCPMADVYWDPTHGQMVFGQGYASALDIVAHEMTHGVTQHTSKLFNYMQSGAISESLSDVFGKLVELTNETPLHRWWIGQNLPDGPYRDMQNACVLTGAPPACDPASIVRTTDSANYSCNAGQGVYNNKNSAINNMAAYLMVDGGTHPDTGISVTGIGINKVARIYYEAETNLLTSGSDYQDLYDALQLACQNLAGGPSGVVASDCQQVKKALDAVKMYAPPANCGAEAAVCDNTDLVPSDLFFDNLEGGGGKWTTSFVTGANAWTVPATGYATSGVNSIWGQDLDPVSESYVAMKTGATLLPGAYLHFSHSYDFEVFDPDYLDGGVLEYSANGGPWTDVGALTAINGYNGSLLAPGNPFDGRAAFVGTSYGYISSRYDLSTLSGKSVRFRFGIGTDNGTFPGPMGWYIDDVRIYTCVTPVTITIDSNPAGLRVLVDGVSYSTPHTFYWASGSGHTLNAVSPQDDGTGVQYSFSSWDGGGPQGRTITASAATPTYTANYAVSGYKLTSTVSPAGAGFVSPDCSSGCWYPGGATATLAAITGAGIGGSSGYIFSSWGGACSGANPATTVSMTVAKSCTANFVSCSDTVKIPAGLQPSIQTALNNANSDETVMVAATTFSETLNVDRAIPADPVTLEGGYDCGCVSADPSAYSAVFGTLTVTSGQLTVKNLIIE